MSTWPDRFAQSGFLAEAEHNIGQFAIYATMVLTVETGEYAMGEDDYILIPERPENDGFFSNVFITRGTYA